MNAVCILLLYYNSLNILNSYIFYFLNFLKDLQVHVHSDMNMHV